jgi:hypothetical protein
MRADAHPDGCPSARLSVSSIGMNHIVHASGMNRMVHTVGVNRMGQTEGMNCMVHAVDRIQKSLQDEYPEGILLLRVYCERSDLIRNYSFSPPQHNENSTSNQQSHQDDHTPLGEGGAFNAIFVARSPPAHVSATLS